MATSNGVGRGVGPATAIEHQAQTAIAALLQVEEVLREAGREWGDTFPVVKELAGLHHLARDAITANQRIIRLIQKAPVDGNPPGPEEQTTGKGTRSPNDSTDR